MRRRVQEHDGEHVEVPHAVDPREERAVQLQLLAAPLPVAFHHLERERARARERDREIETETEGERERDREINRDPCGQGAKAADGTPRPGICRRRPRLWLRPRLTWLMMKKMTVMAAQNRVTSMRNLNLNIRPCVGRRETG